MTFTATQLRAMAEKYEKDAAWYNDRAKAIKAGQANATAQALRQAASDREDAERLDWLALNGASLRIESLHDEQTSGQSARWWIDCPVHTGIRSVDDKHRFTTFREAIDQARQESRHG